MTATLGSLVSETKRNRLSLIGSLTEDTVLHVWDNVAQFVETHMLQQKGVSISGLGTFTFSKRKLEVGNNRAILIQRPVFVLSERFKQTHSLHCVKKHASGQVPLHPLNYTQLSNQTGVRREMVEGAVREVLQALSRAVAAKKSIEFDLKDIGRLAIHDGKAKLSFFREFIYRLDGCCDMEGAFRSSSTDSSICSIISNPQPSSRPSSSLSLPRIQPVVGEEDGEMNLSLEYSGGSSSGNSPSIDHSPSTYEETRLSRQMDRGALRMATICEEDEHDEQDGPNACQDGVCIVGKNGEILSKGQPPPSDKKPTKSTSSGKLSQQTLTPKPTMLLVSSRESPTAVLASLSHQPSRGSMSTSSQQTGVAVRDGESQSRSYTRTTTSSSSGGGGRSNRRISTSCTSRSCYCSLGPMPAVIRPSTCSHKSSAGQELCYLCHQRALQNIPVDLSKERATKEKMYNDTLHEYQRRHELLAMARAQADRTKRRLQEQEVASFNQSIATTIKNQKEVKSSEMDPSYIFSDRLVTPAPQAGQQRYCRVLDSQVESKLSRQMKEREEAERSGREEQERLAKELAAYEELYRRMKAQAVEDYKGALNEQVGLKLARNGCDARLAGQELESRQLTLPQSSSTLKVPPRSTLRPFTPPPHTDPNNTHSSKMTSLRPTTEGGSKVVPPTDHAPQTHPTHPVFGVQQTASLLESRERDRAKEFFLDQLATVEEKQRRTREKVLRTLQQESDMLKTTKEGLKEDRRREKSRRVEARQALEEEWLASTRDKQRRLLEDLHSAKEHGIRLHQQCERYHRCKQCQRKRQNMGKSNILHETRYISGSRLMV